MGFEPLEVAEVKSGFQPLEAPQAGGFTPLSDGESADTPGFLSHLGSLLQNANMAGGLPESAVPNRPLDQMAIGAAMAVNNLETMVRANPFDQNDPDTQRRLAQLKGDRQAAGEVIKEIQEKDSPVAKAVGDALQSIPASSPGLVAAAIPGVNVASAMAIGLGANYVSETASDLTKRMDEFGQTPTEAFPSASAHGLVATGFEALPMGAVVRYMKVGGKVMPILGKVGAGEFTQEAGTQVFDDALTNSQGFTSFTPKQMAWNATEAGTQGVLMAPIMGGVAHTVNRVQSWNAQRRIEKLVKAQAKENWEDTEAGVEMQKAMLKVLGGQDMPSTAQLPSTPELTLEEKQTAAIVREQMKTGLAVPEIPSESADVIESSIQNQFDRGNLALPSLDEGGISPEVLERRKDEYEALKGKPAGWKIIHSRDERVVGLTPKQLGELSAGAVISVGMDNDNYPAGVFNPLMETIGGFVDKYIPGSRVVIVQAPFAPEHQASAFGMHWVEYTSTGPIHFIVPREMPNIGRHGVSDPKTTAAFLGSIAHEFGHAVESQGMWDMLAANVGPDLTRRVMNEVRGAALTQETLDQLRVAAPEEAALIEHWNSLQLAVKEGKLSATEFVEQWAGMRKLAGSAAKVLDSNKSLYDWAQSRAKEAGLPWDGLTAAELLAGKRLSRMGKRDWDKVSEYLGFHEFMAEQFSRAAYAKGELAKSKLGRVFQETLKKLRDLFRTLKTTKGVDGQTIIAPHTTFEAWLEKLTLRGKEMKHPKGKFKLTPEIKKKQEAILRKNKLLEEIKEVLAEVPPEPTPPPEQVPPSKADEMSVSAESLGERLQEAVDMGYVEPEQAQHRRIRGMIKRGQLAEAQAALELIIDDLAKWRSTPHWDKEYVSKVLSRLPEKSVLKAQTIRDTIKQADIRQAERSVYEQFLAQNQGKETFTREELENLVKENIVPLLPAESGEWSDYGVDNIGFDITKDHFETNTVIWKAPRDIPVANTSHHFVEEGYLMHHREVVFKGTPFVVEMQSDVFQKGGPLQPVQRLALETAHRAVLKRMRELSQQNGLVNIWAPEAEAEWERLNLQAKDLEARLDVRLLEPPETEALGQVWEKRLVEEIMARAAGEGRTRVLFANADTVAQVEGWPLKGYVDGLNGKEVEQNGVRLQLTGYLDTNHANGTDYYALSTVEGPAVTFGVENGEVIGEDVGVTEVANYVRDNRESFQLTYGDMQGIYTRYQKVFPKIFKSLHGREVFDSKGFGWWEVSTQATKEKVFAWDKDNPVTPPLPGVGLIDFAGMSVEDYRKPEVVAQAAGMWERLGFESPFFKRWFGNSQVKDATGQPLALWRGDNNRVTYLDPTLRGDFTGVPNAQKAFWFASSRRNAEWYATESSRGITSVLTPEANRQAQAIRGKMEKTRELLNHPDLEKEHRQLLLKKLQQLRDKLTGLEGNAGLQQQAVPHIGQYYLKMENPLVVDAFGEEYSPKKWDMWIRQALENGHDGLVVKNTFDPMESDVYAVFSPEQVKSKENAGTFDPTDMLHWDNDGPAQQATKETVKLLGNFWGLSKLRAMNFAAKATDNIMQLQQVAASQPDDAVLNTFVHLIGRANQMKSDLQFPAEEVGQKMVKSTPHTVNELHRVLREEWKSGVLMGDIVGLDVDGNVVWGREVGMTPANRENVLNWKIVAGEKLYEFLTNQGVKLETPAGKKILDLYLDTRNTFLHQWKGLEIALKEKADRLYGNAPTVLKSEYWGIEQLINKYRLLPFLPQGFFGNHVVLVQKKRSWEEAKEDNRRRFVTVRKLHFEDKAQAQQAFLQLRGLESSGEYRVRTREIKEFTGIPMQLPREFLEHVAATADFTDEQIEELADLMVVSNYEKIDARYAKITERVEGGNEDFKRVFANYTWHNANYIWKTYFRTSMQHMISVSRSEVRALERSDLPAEEIMAQVERKRRNIRMMEQSLSDMLHPPQEFQRAKLVITLTYLAFNIDTALMNLFTQTNTYAAVTSEYGERAGHKAYAKGLYIAATLPWHSSMRDKAKTDAERKELNEIIAVTDQALREGVIDQSYAYFLAGQANASGALLATSNSWLGKAAHILAETGMAPFRLTEKANRYATLYTVYLAERQAGKDVKEAYRRAVQDTNLLQNAYDAGNKPQLFRGKKSIFLMFASYTQFQGWIMLGGYERAQRARAKAEGRSIAPVWRATTVKLWLIYLMLGGLMGVPFAQNLMDIFQFIWRKLFGRTENLPGELRDLVKGLDADPNVVMHGLLHNIGGFDLSGSFGMGRMLPGIDMLNRSYNSVDEAIGKGITTFAGPAGGFYSDLSKALVAFGGGKWNEGFKEFPGAMASVAKATDALIMQNLKPGEGMGATLRDGTRMTRDPETGEFRDLTLKEIAGMALGATPTIVSQNRELAFAEQGEYLYWMSRRQELKKNFLEAALEGDEKLREAAQDAITRFNGNLPDGKLTITGKELADGLRARRKAVQQKENFGTGAKRFRGVVGEVADGY